MTMPNDSTSGTDTSRARTAAEGSRPVLLGIAGSLREGSFNHALLRAAGELASDVLDVRIYEGLGEIPPFNEDREDSPAAAVTELRRSIDEADVLLIATPEYNSSIPGTLKNALDWASRPYGASALADKPAVVVGASPGRGGAAQAQEDLRRVLGRSGAKVLDQGLSVSRAHSRFDDTGRLVDDEARATLAEVVTRLAQTAGVAARSA